MAVWLIIKRFYTACCIWVGVVVVPLMLATRDPDRWDPDAPGVALVYASTLIVLLSVWAPFVQRRSAGLPRNPLAALRLASALLTPIAATWVLWISLALPITLLFSARNWERIIPMLVILAGAILIVLLTWDFARGSIRQSSGAAGPVRRDGPPSGETSY